MHVTAIKTHKITEKDTDLLAILDRYLTCHSENNLSIKRDPSTMSQDDRGVIGEKSILVVTSKIVAICEGRMVEIQEENEQQKDELIQQESTLYLPREENPYNVSLAISHNILLANAGIDESNGNGYYILWPEDPQASANRIREYISQKFGIQNIGVIITDSKTTPLRWGVTAIAIAYSGFEPLKNYMNTKDIFGRPFIFEQMSIMDNLACAAALTMGEGDEQTPLGIISDVPMVEFTQRNPTKEELEKIKITLDEDLYGNFLKNAPWRKGKKTNIEN